MPIQPPWTNPASLRRCHGKRRYPSITQAEIAAEKASYRTGELILAYQCYDCLRFHIGHADQSQKRLRRIADPPPIPSGTCHCCRGPIPNDRLQAAKDSKTTNVYCSDKCRKKAKRMRNQLRKHQQLQKLL